MKAMYNRIEAAHKASLIKGKKLWICAREQKTYDGSPLL
jgi:hypothetical protein